MKIYPIFNRGWLIEFSEGRTVVLSDEEYEKLAVETSHVLTLGMPVASSTGVSVHLNGTSTLLHLCHSDEAEMFANAITREGERRDNQEAP